MARVPTKRLKIGPHTYTVRELSGEEFSREHPDDNGHTTTLGLCNIDYLKIDLRLDHGPGKPLSQSRLDEILLHEVLHAVWSNVYTIYEEEIEERVVHMLAPAILAALRDNKWLAQRLLGTVN